jgi:ATP-dependent DNA ligase
VTASTVAQLKFDGSQYLIHIKNHKAYAVTSKRVSKKTDLLSEKLANLPQVKKAKFPYVKETILVTEVVCESLSILLSERDNFVAGIMNSLPEKAKGNELRLIVHDAIMIEGKNVEELPYKEKYLMLKKVFHQANFYYENLLKDNCVVHLVSNKPVHNKEEEDKLFKEVIKHGDEGIILRDLENNNSRKRKGLRVADCIIYGFTDANVGKYSGLIGAIKLVCFNKDKVVTRHNNYLDIAEVNDFLAEGYFTEVGNISGFDDVTRRAISADKDNYIGKVVAVEYMKMKERMFQPRFHNWRNDKLVSRCTMAQFTLEN